MTNYHKSHCANILSSNNTKLQCKDCCNMDIEEQYLVDNIEIYDFVAQS